MPSYRQGRINEELVREVSDILRGVKDPRVSGSFISITAAKCTPDLKNAKIYYSAIGKGRELTDIKRGLDSAAGYVRSQIAQRLNLRITPEISFIFDDSMEEGAKMFELLKEVEKTLPPEDAENGEDNGNE